VARAAVAVTDEPLREPFAELFFVPTGIDDRPRRALAEEAGVRRAVLKSLRETDRRDYNPRSVRLPTERMKM
jgi:hypothetical protein